VSWHINTLDLDICTINENCRLDLPRYDIIHYLAPIVGPTDGLPHMDKIIKSIVDDLSDLVRIALKADARLVVVSTSEIYGGWDDFYSEALPQIQVTKSKSRKQYLDPKTISGPLYEEANDKDPDAGKIMRLGWQPRYSRDETIKQTVDYMRGLPPKIFLHLCGDHHR